MLCAAADLGSEATAGGSWPEPPSWQPSLLLSDPSAAAPAVRSGKSGELREEERALNTAG